MGSDAINYDELIKLLENEDSGEGISMLELEKIMGKLVSEYNVQQVLGHSITSERFAEEILGFEEVDENEGEEEEGDFDANASATGAGATAVNSSKLGVIQEEP